MSFLVFHFTLRGFCFLLNSVVVPLLLLLLIINFIIITIITCTFRIKQSVLTICIQDISDISETPSPTHLEFLEASCLWWDANQPLRDQIQWDEWLHPGPQSQLPYQHNQAASNLRRNKISKTRDNNWGFTEVLLIQVVPYFKIHWNYLHSPEHKDQ